MTPDTRAADGADPGFYGWKLLAVLGFCVAINSGLVSYGAGVINAYMGAALGLDRRTLGMMFSLLAITNGVAAPIIAVLINRRGARFTLALGSAAVMSGAALMAFWVQSAWQALFAFGVIVALGTGMGGVLTVQAALAAWFRRRAALATGIAMTASGLGGVIGAPAVSRAIESAHGDWRAGWIAIGAMAILSLAAAAAFVRNRPEDLGQSADGLPQGPAASAPPDDWSFAEAIRARALWIVIGCSVAYVCAFFVFLAHAVPHLTDLGHSRASAAAAVSVFTLSSLATRLLSGFVGDRIPTRILWCGALVAMCAGIALLAHAGTPLRMYAAAVLFGGGYGASLLSQFVIVAKYFGARAYASIFGLLAPITTAFSAVAPVAAGWSSDRGGSYAGAFHVLALLVLAAAAAILFAPPPARRRECLEKSA
ncbi:MAG: MFS transporter [Gammaproteobacteria bacterium]